MLEWKFGNSGNIISLETSFILFHSYILFDFKRSIRNRHNMAKILEFFVKQLLMLWCFLSTCFIHWWTYVRKGQAPRLEFDDFLQWQKEEMSKIQKVLKQADVLNKLQCTSLVTKLCKTVDSIIEVIQSTNEPSKFCVVLEELSHIIHKVGALVNECGNQNWCQAVVFQMNNKEAFRELFLDMKCCWDVTSVMDLASQQDSQTSIMSIDFDVPTYDEVQNDQVDLETKLQQKLETLSIDHEDYGLVMHLLGRLQRDLQRAEGGELDTLEVPKDFWKPENVKEIFHNLSVEVYESRWLGIRSATKKMNVPDISLFRKEAGILAGLSHPNLTKFICCGIEESLTESMEVSQKAYLVMEFMEMSLSDILKKQRIAGEKPLPYNVAIDIMHQIASGMTYLHDMHVAHLDLKPANVLLTSKPLGATKDNHGHVFVKLIDYGISETEVTSKPKLQKPEHTKGTRRYMAPERSKDSEACITCPFQADVWSFAMTCSEILSRNEPFHDTQVLREIFPIIKGGERPELPINCQELTMLIEECWVEDPLQRPTFSDICNRLRKLKKLLMRGDMPPNSNDMFPKWPRGGASFQKIFRPLKSYKVVTNQAIEKVDEPTTSDEALMIGLGCNLAKAKGQLEQVNVLGIIGMGGIGKTTLAKAIFDDVKSTYDASCFVQQLKSRSSYEILCDIFQKLQVDKKTDNLVDAQMIMNGLFKEKKILLILDDIKDQAQVDDIIPLDVVHGSKGSTLIITTREWDVIQHRVGENGKVEVGKLDENAAKELFFAHVSWEKTRLSSQFLDLGEKIVEVCNGLPLSLKVMGAFLQDKERLRSWDRALQRMKRGRSLDGDQDGLWGVLRVSFDEGLTKEEKYMFLDIACFFCRSVYPDGMSKERALRIWNHNGTSPIGALNKLVHHSLVYIDKDGNILEMHDQLRAMGRKIAETEYEGTRIWNTFTNMDVTRVEGIFYRGSRNHSLLRDIDIQHGYPSLLRLLSFNGIECRPSETRHNLDIVLTSLAAKSCGLKCLLIDNSNYDIGFESINVTKADLWRTCANLNVLQLSNNKLLEHMPEEILSITTLLELDLHGCSSLKALPEGLGKLTSLTTLQLSRCSSLTILPKGLENLTCLTMLCLSWCRRLTTLPMGLSNLGLLTILDLAGCSSLHTLPPGLEKLTRLENLDLSVCSSLNRIPPGLVNLTSLTNLDMTGCSISELPHGLGNLTSLRTLEFRGCSKLTTLPEDLGNLTLLTSLDLFGCNSLTTLPKGLGKLISLTSLNLGECACLATIPEELGNLTSLMNLDMGRCLTLKTIPKGLGKLISLKTLNFFSCINLTTIPEDFGNLSSLTTLFMKGCSSLTTLPKELGKLTSLTTLILFMCSSLTTLPEEFENLTSLTKLDLMGCWRLTTLPKGLGKLTSLTVLDLIGCSSLTRLPDGLEALPSLRLTLSGCSKLTMVPEGLGT